ncbi:dihydrodipicolinate synthase family protein [Streptomyces sp. NPDC051597]|uniref:dihydrodipicolinate synthase family protein n=1 Tax=Streptomyces sp. NPDC051597 TaxID=3155049 RepID=UPI003417458A
MSLLLPRADGTLVRYEPRRDPAAVAPGGPPLSRTVFSAAHVVADPYAETVPGGPAALDWEATLAFRRHLWAHGLAVAEAMDTAQRGMGLDWPTAAELIRRSAAEARAAGGRIACGAGTDQLAGAASLDEVTAAYEEQLAVVEGAGAQAILMASRALAAVARGPEDYRAVYGRLLEQTGRPVILHWLGPMFDPALAGYWGSADLDAATETFLAIVCAHAARIDGVKVSLLDAGREVALRRRLPDGVKCYTGDDFHYPELIEGDDRGFSHALLGIFDPLGPLAADAVRALDAADPAGFRKRLDPTVGLARHLFGAPTRFYKTGVVLLAWLAGHQEHFTMVGGLQSARSLPHLARAYELADGLGLFPDPEAAASRMRALLTVHGVAS